MMKELDTLACEHFPGLAVRKDLVRRIKNGAVVPTYVLEYLLAQYCATADDATIDAGIESVNEILARHYVQRSDAELIRSKIREQGRHQVIDKLAVTLNDKEDFYEASFLNLGLTKVPVDADTVKANQKLLVGGIWCIVALEYHPLEDKRVSPWQITRLKPIQMSSFDMDSFKNARRHFTTAQWLDLLVHSLGFDPAQFDERGKMLHLLRLVPFCERNYNLIELGPKGTGKSHIYSEFSPHGILISGGEVTVAKLFVNNSNGRIGLVGYWDVVAFDEFAGKQKKTDKALVDIMKNYMANKSFSRGIETLSAEASMVFVGNTSGTAEQMLRQSNLFVDLPEKFYDSAFLDRLHCYSPGWEFSNIRTDMFSRSYGFVVDYLAEVLRGMRNFDRSRDYTHCFRLSEDLSTRDRDGVHKTFSGLMKLLFPAGAATKEEVEEVLRFALEGRARVKGQLMRIDPTYDPVSFGYYDENDRFVSVVTREETQYPQFFKGDDREKAQLQIAAESSTSETEPQKGENAVIAETVQDAQKGTAQAGTKRKDDFGSENDFVGRIYIEEDQKDVTYDDLFGCCLQGARKIAIIDPYIRQFYQVKELSELLDTILNFKDPADHVQVCLFTSADDFSSRLEQQKMLEGLKNAMEPGVTKITFRFSIENAGFEHDRFIYTDNGWRISLGRGLDIYKPYDRKSDFDLRRRFQQYRLCRSTSISRERMTPEETAQIFSKWKIDAVM